VRRRHGQAPDGHAQRLEHVSFDHLAPELRERLGVEGHEERGVVGRPVRGVVKARRERMKDGIAHDAVDGFDRRESRQPVILYQLIDRRLVG
jgi:hypothetical protein